MKGGFQMEDKNIKPLDIPEAPTSTILKATVSAEAGYTETFPWTINKSVTPDTLCICPGSTGNARYTIEVTKGAGETAAFIEGQVCVTNTGYASTKNLKIVVNLTMPPLSTIIASVPVDVSQHPVLMHGETACYDYRLDIPTGSIVPGGTYKVTAKVTITNYYGHIGPYGPSPSDTDNLPSAPTLINDTINVDDTNGPSFEVSSSGSQCYERVFTCEDEGINTNTATIRETEQQSSASVTVICEAVDGVKETVCVQAEVKITPNVAVGDVEYCPKGGLIIGACTGTPVEECTFTVSQNICVKVPLTISAEATVAPAGIVCGSPEICGDPD